MLRSELPCWHVLRFPGSLDRPAFYVLMVPFQCMNSNLTHTSFQLTLFCMSIFARQWHPLWISNLYGNSLTKRLFGYFTWKQSIISPSWLSKFSYMYTHLKWRYTWSRNHCSFFCFSLSWIIFSLLKFLKKCMAIGRPRLPLTPEQEL